MKRFGAMSVGVILATGLMVTGVASTAVAKTVKPPVTTVKSVSPENGPTSGGTVVTIKGKNVIGATAVDFGSAPAASFTPKGKNSIVATAPAELQGTVDITVTSPDGTSATSPADHFTYVGNGPTIQSLDPKVGATTGGTRVTIAGSDLTSVTSVTFGATPATSFVIDSSQAISAVAPPSPGDAAGKVDVVVSGTDGSSPTDPVDVYTYALRVPIVSLISPPSGSAGTQVTISGNRFSKKGTSVDFGGTPATSFTVNSGSSITAVAPAGSGTVDVTVTDAKGTSSASSGDQFTYTSA